MTFSDSEISIMESSDEDDDFSFAEEENVRPKNKKTSGRKAPAKKPAPKKKAAPKKSAATKKKATKVPSDDELENDDDDDVAAMEEDDDVAEVDVTTTITTTKTNKKKKTVEETYQKKSQLEHILLRPDTYVGSVERVTQPMYVLNPESKRIVKKEITFTPGLFKIFDEIIVNAADNKQRDSSMDSLEVEVNGPENLVSVKNNGQGIPVVMHKEHKCHVPTLIFGHLLTGSNFDDDEKKTTGGRNGYGAKLANIFSTLFTVECVDTTNGLKFVQNFRDNMSVAEKPSVSKLTKTQAKQGDYTKITFQPDLARFRMDRLDEDTVGLLSKRAYDVAGCMAGLASGKRLAVKLNGSKLPVTSFESYLKLYDGIDAPVAYEKVNDRWEIGVGVSENGSFQQISFVNSICTSKGGGHTEHVANQIAQHLVGVVKKKSKKQTSDVKKNQITHHLCVFVNCLVENPTFDSQTKEFLTTRPKSFGSDCKPSTAFNNKVGKSDIVDTVLAYARFKDNQALKRQGGAKKKKLTGIAKLDDANHAGSAKSKDCTLILTEGDSAKSLAMSGLSVVGRDYYGVFPLKGKPLNVREAKHAQILKNEEIKNVVDILGLKFGTEYTVDNVKTLRYGHLMIMADQDHDGSHIKGLVINFIHHFWPSLLDVPGFLQQFITPIVKATKGKKSKTFFTLPEYMEWRESTGNNAKGWTVKYYKGLGTSTSAEAKEYFSNLDLHEVHFSGLSADVPIEVRDDDDDNEHGRNDNVVPDAVPSASQQATGGDLIEMAFKKDRVEDRKSWLNNLEKGTYLNYSNARRSGVRYSDFVNRELILFSQADNQRSIPHAYDGFKPSQRKVLFSCFKRKLKNEIKVAQLAGYVSEHSAYHHGEQSLAGTIVGMAQSFCGSNNVNLLSPVGQFGTRRMGGKDAASPRYIFTKLEAVTRTIFHPDDDALLNYLEDDGLSIEPEYYVPVIPMVLVNGTDGIGTGWSTFVPNYCPRQIVRNLRAMIDGGETETMLPQYYGWGGEVVPETGKREGNFLVRGTIDRVDDTTLVVSELPIKVWTQNYKIFLESMLSNDKSEPDIKDFKEGHTDTTVSFTITATKDKIDSFEKEKDGLLGKFKLTGKIHTTNMNLFDELGRILKYADPADIMKSFFHVRLDYYSKRKDHLLKVMRRELRILSNKARFVEEVCRGELIVNNRKRKDILHDLRDRGYELFDGKDDGKKNNENEDEEDPSENEDDAPDDAMLARGYEYLLGMKIWNLTFEKVEQLREQVKLKQVEVEELEATPPSRIWRNDLDAVEEALDVRDQEIEFAASEERKAQKKNNARRVKKEKAKNSRKKKGEWDSDTEEDDESDDNDSSSDDSLVARLPQKKKAPARKRQPPAKKRAQDEAAKAKAKTTDAQVDTLSSQMKERLTVSPAKNKPSLQSSIDKFLSSTSSPLLMKGKKRLTTKEPVLSVNEEEVVAPVKSKKKTATATTTKKKAAAPKKPAAKRSRAAPKKKKQEIVLSDDEEEEEDVVHVDSDSDDEDAPPPPPRARSARARAKPTKTYAVDLVDSDEDDQDAFSEEDDDSDFD